MRLGAHGVIGEVEQVQLGAAWAGAASLTAQAFCRSPRLFSSHPTRPRQLSSYDIIGRESTSRATMKVTIKEWNAVAAWRWDMPDDDVCGICRNPYDSTCSKCKFPGDECPLCR